MSDRSVFRITNQRGKHDCGVATLATLLGRSYEDTLLAAGRLSPKVLKTGLYSSDLIRIAAEFGSTLVRRVQRIDLDEHTGILGLEYPSKRLHFVFLTNGLVFDPQEDNVAWDAYTFVKREKVKVIDLMEEA